MAHKRTDIPDKVKLFLWAKSAGRCQICNMPVYEDPLTFEEVNIADHAHIIGSSPDGPRGDTVESDELAKAPSNLMLLCKSHHKKIDTKEYLEKYTPDILRELKRRHEERIEFVTSIGEENKSHVLLYAANIGQNSNPVNFLEATSAMLPERYPAEKHPIKIQITGSVLTDDRTEYWIIERNNLIQRFENLVKDRIDRSEISHLSVFALAPIPLLIQLGALLTDKVKTDVYQLIREPQGWKWQPDSTTTNNEFVITQANQKTSTEVALILSLSGTIPIQDITDKLGHDIAIWQMTIAYPNNDFVKSKELLSVFRHTFRKLLNDIKAEHGRYAQIHLFPAIPISIAIEIGRVWMPKADLPILIYDRNRSANLNFFEAFKIG